jgi:hypothetical protein
MTGHLQGVADNEGSFRTCFYNNGGISSKVSVELLSGAEAKVSDTINFFFTNRFQYNIKFLFSNYFGKDYAELARENNLRPADIEVYIFTNITALIRKCKFIPCTLAAASGRHGRGNNIGTANFF